MTDVLDFEADAQAPEPDPVVITAPGVYDLDERTYHRDPVEGGSLSSTGARTLATRPPARFHYDRVHGREDRKVFDLGRAAHFRVLGQGMQIAEVPYDSWRTNKAKALAAQAREAGLTPLLSKDVEVVDNMAAELCAHPTIAKLLARPGRAEQVMVYVDPATGVWCRVMIDWLPDVARGRRLVVDYKTTEDASPAGFARSMARYGYHQQGPFYCDALTHLGLDNGVAPKFLVIAQEKSPPHLAAVYAPNDEAVRWGQVLNHHARETYARCTALGHWPGYSTDPQELALPGYLLGAYERAAEDGAFEFHTVTEEDVT
jgi:hypothetical protein